MCLTEVYVEKRVQSKCVVSRMKLFWTTWIRISKEAGFPLTMAPILQLFNKKLFIRNFSKQRISSL